jgi:GNAT superfamily N-acetyltransferase
MREPVQVRESTPADATALAELCTLWGYPADRVTVAARLSRVTHDTDVVLVAVAQSEVVGWVHVGLYSTLGTDNAAHILGLVVDEKSQGRGIGRLLMSAAEAWARERGCRTMRVRSRISRHDAHAFYKHLGYRQTKTSFTFVRTLADKRNGSESSEP